MSFCQKKSSNKQQKEREKQTQKIAHFFSFVHFEALPNRDYRVGMVTISRNCHEHDDKF